MALAQVAERGGIESEAATGIVVIAMEARGFVFLSDTNSPFGRITGVALVERPTPNLRLVVDNA